MIAGQNQALTAQERQPAGRLRALACLSDRCKVEGSLSKQLDIKAGKRGTDDGRHVEDALDNLGLQPPRVGQKSPSFLALSLPRAWFRSSAGELARLAEQGESLFGQLARLAPIWVIVDYDVERMLAKRGKNAGRVAEAHCLFVLSQK